MKKKSATEIEKEKKIEARIFHKMAVEHFGAFVVLRQAVNDKKLASIKYYLGLRSLELIMKAYIRNFGVSNNYLKAEMKHDLTKLGRGIDVLGIDLEVKHRYVIVLLNKLYKGKLFEYPDANSRKIPSLAQLEETLRYVFGILEPILLEEFKKARQAE
jgi:hypothetical protein